MSQVVQKRRQQRHFHPKKYVIDNQDRRHCQRHWDEICHHLT